MYNRTAGRLGSGQSKQGELGQMPTMWQPTFGSAVWWSFLSSVAAGIVVYYALEAKSRR